MRIEIVGGEFVVHHVGGNPHNHVARRLAEEFERQWPGAPVFVEAFLTDTSDVQLDWHVARGGRRDLVAAARADTELRIDGERPFVVVPNSLLRPL
ncbi:hypothetical protein [Cryptosporangium sp. NPDC051539]|uniref:hypothetical protein n=1 Tax=Cryptosporangium sp. NPDC051539 TaxID=3363962 RepID=UPI0037B57E08